MVLRVHTWLRSFSIGRFLFFEPLALHLDEVRHDVFVGFLVHGDLVPHGSLSSFQVPGSTGTWRIHVVLLGFQSVHLLRQVGGRHCVCSWPLRGQVSLLVLLVRLTIKRRLWKRVVTVLVKNIHGDAVHSLVFWSFHLSVKLCWGIILNYCTVVEVLLDVEVFYF